MAKLEILSPTEQITFNAPPDLSSVEAEQKKCFQLPSELNTWLESVDNPNNKVGFLLQWSYCQLGVRLYPLKQFRESDAKVVCQQYNLDYSSVQLKNYNSRTYNHHKQIIRQHINLKPFDEEAEKIFLESIEDRVARHYSPKQILQDIYEFLKRKNIEIPGYNRFALNITEAISDYDKHLIQSVERILSEEQKVLWIIYLRQISRTIQK